MLRHYPAYRIEDFYIKTYREGGLTYQQFIFMHEMADEAEYDQNRFVAAIHGIDIEAEADNTSPLVSDSPRKSSTPSSMLFRDPKEYSHLSDQERQELTEKMLGHWRPMGSNLMGAKAPVIHN